MRRARPRWRTKAYVSPRARERLFGQRDHVRLYGRDYTARLEEVGFDVSLDPYVNELGDEAFARFGFRRHPGIYVCSKPRQ